MDKLVNLLSWLNCHVDQVATTTAERVSSSILGQTKVDTSKFPTF